MSEHERQDRHSFAPVVQDFYYSFWLSQGSEGLQERLLKGVVAQYDPSKIQHLCENEKELFAKFSSLHLPGAHEQKNQSVVSWEFMHQGSMFLDEIVIAHKSETPREFTLKDTAKLVYGMIDRDLKYIKDDATKIRTYEADDPYKSYFREYIMRSAPTGSEVYDTLFLDTRRRLTDKQLHSRTLEELDALVVQWERRHPGEMFLPVDADQHD